MTLSTQPYKGTRDFYPADKRIQNWIFDELRAVVGTYGYLEYDGPMLESFDLYAAKTGEEIVSQQLYSFEDRGGRKVAMRPEMTPTLARMVAARAQELPKPVRWFSIPNLWRYERPQRGRLREHWQLNVDVLGGDSLQADAEVMLLALDIFARFGAQEFVSIRVNNRRLMDHLFETVLGLDAEGSRKLAKALDAKAKVAPEVFQKWLTDLGLDAERIARLESFLAGDLAYVRQNFPCPGVEELDALFAQLPEALRHTVVVFDASVMRGMDYYTGTVFEAYDVSPDNRRALFGGGRYDNLVGLFTKQKLSGMGFGLGDVSLRDFLETHGKLPSLDAGVDVFVTTPDAGLVSVAQDLARRLRQRDLRTVLPLGFEGFGAQLKSAAKLGARWVVLLGQNELARGQVAIKDLGTGQQQDLALDQVADTLAAWRAAPKT